MEDKKFIEILTKAFLNDLLFVTLFKDIKKRERALNYISTCKSQYYLSCYKIFEEKYGFVLLSKHFKSCLTILDLFKDINIKMMYNIGLINTLKLFKIYKEIDKQNIKINDYKRNNLVLGPIAILPEHQNNGTGIKLMKKVINHLNKYDGCYLDTQSISNVKFFEKFGFKIVSEKKILSKLINYTMYYKTEYVRKK